MLSLSALRGCTLAEVSIYGRARSMPPGVMTHIWPLGLSNPSHSTSIREGLIVLWFSEMEFVLPRIMGTGPDVSRIDGTNGPNNTMRDCHILLRYGFYNRCCIRQMNVSTTCLALIESRLAMEIQNTVCPLSLVQSNWHLASINHWVNTTFWRGTACISRAIPLLTIPTASPRQIAAVQRHHSSGFALLR